jgi:hypothetical protein
MTETDDRRSPKHPGALGAEEIEVKTWRIFSGTGVPHDGLEQLPDPPSWRVFKDEATRQQRPFSHDQKKSIWSMRRCICDDRC